MDYLNYKKNEDYFTTGFKPLIIDDYLPKEEYGNLYHTLMGQEMEWNFEKTVDYIEDEKFMFTHLFWTPKLGQVSKIWDRIKLLIEDLKPQVLIKIKANLQTKTKDHIENNFHYDHELVGSRLSDGTLISYTAIYYVNTNNGYTLFEDGNCKVDCVGNRMIIFDSSKLHKSISSTDQKTRVVINFNYFTSLYNSTNQAELSKKLFKQANA